MIDLWEWQYQGKCRDADPEIFFHPEGERGGTRRRRDEAAKAVCKQRYLEFGCEGQGAQIKGHSLQMVAAQYASGALAQVVN